MTWKLSYLTVFGSNNIPQNS